jgi:hypothetical protein
VPPERERRLPDAERSAAMRRVHAVLPAVTQTRGGARCAAATRKIQRALRAARRPRYFARLRLFHNGHVRLYTDVPAV